MSAKLGAGPLILYGSQTGNAASIAQLLGTEVPTCRVFAMKDYGDVSQLKQEKALVVVCSTTGAGDCPDNASRFWGKLKRTKEAGFLKGLQYAVLGTVHVFSLLSWQFQDSGNPFSILCCAYRTGRHQLRQVLRDGEAV